MSPIEAICLVSEPIFCFSLIRWHEASGNGFHSQILLIPPHVQPQTFFSFLYSASEPEKSMPLHIEQ